MMAKMFYTMEEAKAALGRSEDEIKQLSRDGRLREFRDGPRLMFKADQVEQLRAELSSGQEPVDLGVSDSGGLIGLVDTTGASGTSITLAEDTQQGTVGGDMRLKDDTAMAGDLGLGGSLGGIPSPGRSASGTSIPLAGSVAGGSVAGIGHGSGTLASGSIAGGSTAGRGGVNVLGGDDDDIADPSAQTAISSGRDQYAVESVGSGSGLLDLTRESDDTSLGAVLDEISPGGTAMAQRSGGFGSGAGRVILEETAPTARFSPTPMTVVEAYDPLAPAFGLAALAGFGAMLFGAWILLSAAAGALPDMARTLAEKQWYIVFGIGLAVALVLFVIGFLAGKAGGGRRATR
jgi:hypothetical protein